VQIVLNELLLLLTILVKTRFIFVLTAVHIVQPTDNVVVKYNLQMLDYVENIGKFQGISSAMSKAE
jgi:hypothetical protein